MTLVPNPHYWDAGNVLCPELKFQAVSDGRTALLMLKGGDLDLITYTPTDFADSLIRQQKTQGKWPELHSMPVFGTYYLIFNCQRKPFDDPRVRLALSLAVNRQEVVNVLNAGQRPLGLLVPPDSINGYASPPALPTDIQRARKLLADAGFPEGRGLKTIDFLFNTESTHGKVAQAVGQMWQSQLGVSVNYRGLDGGGFRAARQKDHDFDVARGGWYGDYPDPSTWLDLLRSHDGNNDGKYSSSEYDDLMAATDREANVEKRFQLLRQAEDIIINREAPLIPLYQYADGYMYDETRLKGAEMNVRMMTQLKWVRRQSP
jgi:oligopeptide transport system substrate-binding protein